MALVTVYHYTTRQALEEILAGRGFQGPLSVSFPCDDLPDDLVFNVSRKEQLDSKPADAHEGEGVYATSIEPGSMPPKDIVHRLWRDFASRSTKYLERVRCYIAFELDDSLLIPARKHVYKLNTDARPNWFAIRVVGYGETDQE